MNWHWQCAYCGIWTDNEIPLLIEFNKKHRKQAFCCSDECKEKARFFYGRIKRMTPLFLVLVAISGLFIIAGILYTIFISAGCLIMGVTALVLPYATSEQFAEYGVKKTVKLVRIIGALSITILCPLFIILHIMQISIL